MIFLCACIVRGGIEAIGRAATLFLPLFIVPLLILIVLLYGDFDFGNLFPVLGNGILPPFKGAIVPGAWFTEFFLITFLLPYVSDKERANRHAMMAVTIVMVMLLMVDLVVLFVLGPTIDSRIYPLMTVARYISIANFFEHLESTVMAIWVIGVFVKTSVFYYAAVLGTAQWFNLSDYRPIVWPTGIFITIFSLWSLPNSVEVERHNVGTFPPFALCVQVLIPLLLLGIALVKKKAKRR
ncbi:Spore germination protein YndE [compost metagenome]